MSGALLPDVAARLAETCATHHTTTRPAAEETQT